MSARFDVTLRLSPEVGAWIREAHRTLGRERRTCLPVGVEPPAGLPREVVDLLLGEDHGTGLVLTDTPGGLRLRSAVGGGSVDAALRVLLSAETRFGREAVQQGNERAIAEILLSPLWEAASPETLRAAQDRLEERPGARVSFAALHAGEIILGADPELARAAPEEAHAALLEARRGLAALARMGRPAMALEAALALARSSARAELGNRLEAVDDLDDDGPTP